MKIRLALSIKKHEAMTKQPTHYDNSLWVKKQNDQYIQVSEPKLQISTLKHVSQFDIPVRHLWRTLFELEHPQHPALRKSALKKN